MLTAKDGRSMNLPSFAAHSFDWNTKILLDYYSDLMYILCRKPNAIFKLRVDTLNITYEYRW